MQTMQCPLCRRDVGLADHEVVFDGTQIQGGGNFETAWVEQCPGCQSRYTIRVAVGPITVRVTTHTPCQQLGLLAACGEGR